MTEANPEQMTRTISITLPSQSNGQYICELSSLNDKFNDEIWYYGQTKEHAIALEQLAEHYRQMEEQRSKWDAVERSESEELTKKQYHVMLHYEDTITAESKFAAMHNTIMGNTVVETAKITVTGIANNLLIETLT